MTESAEQQRARLAHEASVTALEQQRHDVAELRARTGILIAATSLGASFLGARALSGRPEVVPTVTALAALVTALVFGTLVLLPQPHLSFSVRGSVLYADLADTGSVVDQHLVLAARLDASWMENQKLVRRLNRWFQVAAVALVIQIFGWTFAVFGSL